MESLVVIKVICPLHAELALIGKINAVLIAQFKPTSISRIMVDTVKSTYYEYLNFTESEIVSKTQEITPFPDEQHKGEPQP